MQGTIITSDDDDIGTIDVGPPIKIVWASGYQYSQVGVPAPPPPPSGDGTDAMYINETSAFRSLTGNKQLISTNGRVVFRLWNGEAQMLFDGATVWRDGQSGGRATRIRLMPDGQLVTTDDGQSMLFRTATQNKGVVRLRLQNDCNLVMRNAAGSAVWASGAKCR